MTGWEAPRRRGRLLLTTAGLAVALAAALLVALAAGERSTLPVADAPTRPPAVVGTPVARDAWTSPRAGLWRTLPDAPLTPRVAHAVVPVGDRVAVWGGFDDAGLPLTDGGLFDPELGTWQPLPTAAVDDGAPSLTTSTGRSVVVVSGSATHVLDPTAGTSVDLPPPALPRGHLRTDQLVGGGGHVVAASRPTRAARRPWPAVHLLAPDSTTWTRLPDPPVRFAPGDLVTTDGRLVAIVTRAMVRRAGAVVLLDLAATTPSWRRVAAPELLADPALTRVLGAVVGTRLVVVGVARPGAGGGAAPSGGAAVLDGARWHDAAPPPPSSLQVDGLRTDRGIVVWDRRTGTGSHLDAASRQWERLPPAPVPPGPPRPAAWTGVDLVAWGGFDAAGAMYRVP